MIHVIEQPNDENINSQHLSLTPYPSHFSDFGVVNPIIVQKSKNAGKILLHHKYFNC